MHLDFELCDRKQNVLTRLDNRRPGGRAEIGLDAPRRGFCPLSLEDPAYAHAEAVETLLRVTLKGPEGFSRPLVIARVIIPEQGSGEGEEALGLNASDPLLQLDNALIRKVSGSTWEALTFAATEQEQIMWALIAAAETHGVIKGTLSASGVKRDRTYLPGKEVGPALVEMSEVIGGPDFDLEPVAGVGTDTIARFNTYHPRQGSDKSADVVFVHGAAPYTAQGFNFAPGGNGICNRVVVIGAPLNNEGEEESPFATFPSYVAEHAGSIAQFGVWEQVIQLEDVVEGATLQAHAEAFIAANAVPIPYFDFTAAPEVHEDEEREEGEGIPPVFGIDYWIGDTVGCQAYLGAASIADDGTPLDSAGDPIVPLELTGRITDATVTELESGQIAVKLSCGAEVKSTGITGKAISLKVPEVVE